MWSDRCLKENHHLKAPVYSEVLCISGGCKT